MRCIFLDQGATKPGRAGPIPNTRTSVTGLVSETAAATFLVARGMGPIRSSVNWLPLSTALTPCATSCVLRPILIACTANRGKKHYQEISELSNKLTNLPASYFKVADHSLIAFGIMALGVRLSTARRAWKTGPEPTGSPSARSML